MQTDRDGSQVQCRALHNTSSLVFGLCFTLYNSANWLSMAARDNKPLAYSFTYLVTFMKQTHAHTHAVVIFVWV